MKMIVIKDNQQSCNILLKKVQR